MRVILGKPPRTPSSSLRQQLNWSTLHQRRHNLMIKQVHSCALNLAPPYLCSKFTRNSTAYTTNTRGALDFHINRPNTKVHLNTKERFIIIDFPWRWEYQVHSKLVLNCFIFIFIFSPLVVCLVLIIHIIGPTWKPTTLWMWYSYSKKYYLSIYLSIIISFVNRNHAL